jgi:hypothetical protein
MVQEEGLDESSGKRQGGSRGEAGWIVPIHTAGYEQLSREDVSRRGFSHARVCGAYVYGRGLRSLSGCNKPDGDVDLAAIQASNIISLKAAEPTESRTLILLAAALLMQPEALQCIGAGGRAAAWALPGLVFALCWWAIAVLNDVFRQPVSPARAIS